LKCSSMPAVTSVVIFVLLFAFLLEDTLFFQPACLDLTCVCPKRLPERDWLFVTIYPLPSHCTAL
jgi:hypothetical protein